nr:MAG TPA: hypothetical protein [Caudoviricetes sp.]
MCLDETHSWDQQQKKRTKSFNTPPYPYLPAVLSFCSVVYYPYNVQ